MQTASVDGPKMLVLAQPDLSMDLDHPLGEGLEVLVLGISVKLEARIHSELALELADLLGRDGVGIP